MALLTKEKLEAMLERPVDRAHLLIAKNMILGSDEETIAMVLGVTVAEIQEVGKAEEFKEVFILVSAHHNEQKIDTSLTIDEIESKAWSNVAKRLDRETDIEVNARIAMMANRAQRRNTSRPEEVLNPREAGTAVRISLSKRVIEQLQNGQIARASESRLLVEGRNLNPTFDQVQGAMTRVEKLVNQKSGGSSPALNGTPGDDGLNLDEFMKQITEAAG